MKTKFIDFCGKKKPTDEQQVAIFESKSIVAAGAGSGKTATLAQRFLWLVYGKGFSADQILTMTFTKDAAANMKSKIFKTLQKAVKEKLLPNDAQLKAFSNATISTTDSFCSEVVKMDCVQYGIPTNFSIEEDSDFIAISSDIVDKVLKNFEGSEQLNRYLSFYSIDNIKETMFCLAKDYICISDPINTDDILSFAKNYYSQNKIDELTDDLFNLIDDFENTDFNKRKDTYDQAIKIFKSNYKAGDINALEALLSDFGGNCANDIKPYRDEIKKVVPKLIIAIIAHKEENLELLSFICEFIKKYQEELLNHKKETGLVTFHDVMKLTSKILKENDQVRKFYSEKFKAIMVDEFQDNNEDNKNLIYLLAATPAYKTGSDIDASVIDASKIFMVGDEKQSIYKFRNADVSVFKGIANELGEQAKCELTQNFRSEKAIIETVNALFSSIMGTNRESFEADFKALFSTNDNVDSSISFQYLIEDKKIGSEYVSSLESEAIAVANKINDIVNKYPEKYKIKDKNPSYSDIAILLKVGTHQGYYEKALRNLGIPVDVSESKTLTTEAILNDFYVVLQLAIYGESDQVSKYAYLKGPFCRLTDRQILDRETKDSVYEQHSQTTKDLRQYLKTHDISHTVSFIWNNLGYRYFIVGKEDNQAFEEHYDYIFKLAIKFDNENKTIVDFLSYIRPMLGAECAIKNLSIQKEAAAGVKIMSIHKSKGLEFPIVFVADMQSGAGSPGGFSPKVFLSKTKKITLPFCPTVKEDKLINPYETELEDEIKKENAETKRVLYVAATRAQYHLIFSGVISKTTGEIKDDKHCSQLDYFVKAIDFNQEKSSFGNIKFEPLEYVKIEDAQKTLHSENQGHSYSVYKENHFVPMFQKQVVAVTEKGELPNGKNDLPSLPVDSIFGENNELKKEFGSLVHKIIENNILNNMEPVSGYFEGHPEKEIIYASAQKLADNFLSSNFKKGLSGYTLIPEKAFMINEAGQLKNGVIDLLCIGEKDIIIVDYKTDRTKDPEQHRKQIESYTKAAESIYKRPVKAYLFYLRSAESV